MARDKSQLASLEFLSRTTRLSKVGFYKTKIVVHETGERLPMVIDTRTGMPVDIALEFLIANCRGRAPNTILRVAEVVCLLLDWGDMYIKPEGIIGRLLAGNTLSVVELHSLSEHLRTSFRTDTKKTERIVAPETHAIRIARAKNFCLHLMLETQSRIPLSDRKSTVLIERIKLMEGVFDDLATSKSVTSYSVNSLDSTESAALAELLDPDHLNNPFKGWETRLRNRSLLESMLYLGLRPGEALSLRIPDVKFGFPTTISVVRRPHPEDDPRRNPAAVKRNARVLPLDHPSAAEHLREYLQNVRPILEARASKTSPFVFLSIQRGAPMSSRSVQKIVEKARGALTNHLFAPSDAAVSLKPMSMRHTFSNDIEDALVAQGIDEVTRRQHLMQLRGDSSTKSSEPYIIRSRAKQAMKHLQQRQRQLFSQLKTRNEDVPF